MDAALPTVVAASPGRYRPRLVSPLGLWRAGDARLKAYAIDVDGTALPQAAVREAEAIVAAQADEVGSSVGFVLLHRGEEAVWLLLHWWMAGGILAERLWRSPLLGPVEFASVDRPLMACVWELVPIGFERDAYVETLMAGKSQSDYLARIMPEGWY